MLFLLFKNVFKGWFFHIVWKNSHGKRSKEKALFFSFFSFSLSSHLTVLQVVSFIIFSSVTSQSVTSHSGFKGRKGGAGEIKDLFGAYSNKRLVPYFGISLLLERLSNQCSRGKDVANGIYRRYLPNSHWRIMDIWAFQASFKHPFSNFIPFKVQKRPSFGWFTDIHSSNYWMFLLCTWKCLLR